MALTNTGAFPLSWSATADAEWLVVIPTVGSLEGGQTAILSLAPSLDGLVDGEHAANVTISAPGGAGGPQVVNAMLLIGTPTTRSVLIIAERASGHSPFGDSPGRLAVAQTFVAPSAAIHEIVVGLSRKGTPAYPVTATIRRTLGGPDLATVELPAVASIDYRAPSSVVGTFPAPVATVPGESYLLILGVPAANANHFYRWSVDTKDPYPDGMVQVGAKAYRYQDAIARIVHDHP